MNNKIVEDLLNNKKFMEALTNICPDKKYKDDLLQEFCLILLEYDKTKLQAIYEKGDMLYFGIRILLNQYKSKNSPFYKKYKKPFVEMRDDIFILDELVDDRNYELIKFRINELLNSGVFWKDAHLFKIYFFGYFDEKENQMIYPSTRDIEKLHSLGALKMDHTSISKSIRRTMEYILGQLLNEGLINKNELGKKWKKLF